MKRVSLPLLITFNVLTAALWAQPPGVVVQNGPGGPRPVPPNGQPGQPPGQPPNGAPGADGKPADAKKEGDAASPPAITRPATPKSSGDRQQLTIRPDSAGKVQLNFQGQKWLDVLDWYAEIANLSLDWQEVPGDYLNLRTQRSYSVEEIRDVLNRHLMDRGYTLLRSGEVLIVANLKKLDPSLVPRVMPEDLENLQEHEFVRTSFKLDWLIAEQTVEELKPLLSPNGKIWALKATNRIEALDAVGNLRSIYDVLKDEQSGHGQERLVREFRLEHTRADEVYELLLGLLGKEKPKKDEGPMDPRRMMQMQQQMMQMQQMQQNQQGGKPQPQKPGEIHLVVNRRENSILVNGPPDQVAIVEQAVKQLDVSPDSANSLLQNPNRMQIYRLASIDPEPLVETLSEVGNLDPETQLRVDAKNKSIIAYATLADHVTIRSMIEKLDGTDRRFEVIRLRKLEADYVAGTIQFMMGEEEKPQQQRRSYYFYDPFGAGSGGSSEENASRKFRVDADVEHNRLLVWVNDIEFEEIQNLLVKLGEIPPAGSRAATFRRLDSIPLEDAPYLIERLREAWPGLGDNPLQLKIHPRADDGDQPTLPLPLNRPTKEDPSTSVDPSEFLETLPTVFRFSKSSVSHTGAARTLAVAHEKADSSIVRPPAPSLPETLDRGPQIVTIGPAQQDHAIAQLPRERIEERPTSKPPVMIELDPEGRWVLRSEDTAALDQLEDLLNELSPPRRDYKLFQLQHSTSWAYGIALTLEEFFKDEEEKSSPNTRRYYYYDSAPQEKKEANRLSKRRPLKFIADSDSNSILVVGADPHQLRTIADLIEYYDQPVASDAKALRRTEIFQIQHSQAQTIAEAIKDVYRDLLSENDKALQQQNQNKEQQRASDRSVTYVYDTFGDSGGDKKASDPPAPVRFKGALSIGIDEVSNSIIVSSTETLLLNIRMIVERLDQAAVPKLPTMQVVHVGQNVPTDVLQEKLAKLLKEQKRQQAQQPQQGQQNRPQNPQPQVEEGPFP
ncbi:hypothetical protein GC163_07250 [bacterium]|nr:hypothetical protein [bacterium]